MYWFREKIQSQVRVCGMEEWVRREILGLPRLGHLAAQDAEKCTGEGEATSFRRRGR